eukprot:42076_1
MSTASSARLGHLFHNAGDDVPIRFDNKSSCGTSQSAYNQFEMDAPRVSDVDDDSINSVIDDDYERLHNITPRDILRNMQKEFILYESLIKVYSATKQGYIDVTAILTRQSRGQTIKDTNYHNLYFVRPDNYPIWTQFRDRSKINDVLHGNDIKIDEHTAVQLTENLDIIDDEKINQVQIAPYLYGKTKSEIKLDIILNENHLRLPQWFGLDSDTLEIKGINCVRIDNINAIDIKYMDAFIYFIFEDTPWIDRKIKRNSNIVRFQKYHTHSTIHTLNSRKDLFCKENGITHSDEVIISEYRENQTHDVDMHQECKVIYFHSQTKQEIVYQAVAPLELADIPYCFILKTKNDDANDEGLICHLKTMPQSASSVGKNVDIKKRNKMMNDFTYDNTNNKTNGLNAFSKNFNFGIYLHYWKGGYANSVVPRYKTLKEELLLNKHAKLTSKQYYGLYETCLKLYKSVHIKADDIGINNRKFKIAPGSPITINHLISVKLYTDFTKIQNEFKRHCRRQTQDEAIESIVERNMEIAHWCRYLKECCAFYGQRMKPNMVVYTGLNCKLLFDSLMQHFECPLSTTVDDHIANRFAEGTTGVILKLKAANPKTRYFDVSRFSQFPDESERLFMGSSLKIVDIFINFNESNHYISAIQMLEQVLNGQFIDGNAKAERRLLSLLESVVGLSILEQIVSLVRNANDKSHD